jgi:hypothetical protein
MTTGRRNRGSLAASGGCGVRACRAAAGGRQPLPVAEGDLADGDGAVPGQRLDEQRVGALGGRSVRPNPVRAVVQHRLHITIGHEAQHLGGLACRQRQVLEVPGVQDYGPGSLAATSDLLLRHLPLLPLTHPPMPDPAAAGVDLLQRGPDILRRRVQLHGDGDDYDVHAGSHARRASSATQAHTAPAHSHYRE